MLPGFGNWGFFHDLRRKVGVFVLDQRLLWYWGVEGPVVSVFRPKQKENRFPRVLCSYVMLSQHCWQKTSSAWHTHTHIRMQSLIIESKTRLWCLRAEALKRKTSHAPSFHSFICTSLQLRRKEKEERSGHSEEVDHTTLITQMQTWGEKRIWGRKRELVCLGNGPKPACLGLSLAIWLWICENWHQKRLIRDSLHKHKLQRAHKSSGTHKITQELRVSIESNTIKH